MNENEEEERIMRFIEEVMNPTPDTRPVIARNLGCEFTEKVIDYLWREWDVDLIHFSVELQDKAMDMIDEMKKGKQSVPNVCAQIAAMLR